jgi:signal transduction histidine kinase
MAENLKLAYGELESEIAERKHAEAEVKTNLEQIKAQALTLEKANRVKSEFLSVISHELRTPLNVILGSLWLLREKAAKADYPEETQLVANVEQQSKLLLTIVNSILETTRIEADSATVEWSDCALDRVFDSLKSNCEALITAAGKFEKILQNINENAIKFTDEGSVTISALRCRETAPSKHKSRTRGWASHATRWARSLTCSNRPTPRLREATAASA